MPTSAHAPETSMLRLSRYHCFVGQLLRSEEVARVTSRTIAEQLGVSEETVRRDLAYVDMEGRPGAGYDPAELYEALEAFLGLTEEYPYVGVGSAAFLGALTTIFPPQEFGLRPVAYFSDQDADTGAVVDGIELRPLAQIPSLVPSLGTSVALVGCAPDAVDDVLRLLDESGVRAALMLTPVLRPRHPEGMTVTYFRIPCALKSLAATVGRRAERHCCGGTAASGGPSAQDAACHCR